ncbi:ABC transporter ATP-binding protein [Patiriisocius marinistellae]|uniref:ABC transporter ATP-binding protein n=1 Tax=Patiriisocius marinistellae TaxID=2494560 RepID=A0A5J4G0H6_9FLAO|nr:ABC transporter ATP-binding protein [Patiriisocius marinistellae]GEQ85976.1 ABC transporter ATP-binding protein [Patiriisocius marinistellae]
MASEILNNVLIAKNLSIGYPSKKGDTIIAEGLHFELKKGELIGLVGSNGIGKSTLLRTLSATQLPLNGSIILNGSDISENTSLQRATQLSLVLTEAPASKNLTVLELISLGRQPHTSWMGTLTPLDLTKIEEAIEATDLVELQNKNCYELSDGQLQRVYIARALAQDTPIIILDEPTTHLDLYHRAYILKLLKKLAVEKQKTILFSTHEIDIAIQLADTMMVMTVNNLAIGSPCKLIEKGKFDALFPPETIHFDKTTGRFSVKD